MVNSKIISLKVKGSSHSKMESFIRASSLMENFQVTGLSLTQIKIDMKGSFCKEIIKEKAHFYGLMGQKLMLCIKMERDLIIINFNM
jgi:hypothetical protein